MHKQFAGAALAALPVIAAVAFGNPANASAANQNQPAATPPTADQCAPISNMSPKQVLDLARNHDQQVAFGAVLNQETLKNCPVPTMTYNQLRGAIDGAQTNNYWLGLGPALAVIAVGGGLLLQCGTANNQHPPFPPAPNISLG